MSQIYNIITTSRQDAVATYEQYLTKELQALVEVNIIVLPLIVPTKMFGFENRIRTLFLYLKQWLKIIKEYKGGSIHFLSGTEKMSYLPIFYKFEKCILTATHIGESQTEFTRFNRYIFKKLFKSYDEIIVWTHKVKQDIIENYGISADKIHEIPLGCDLSYFKPSSKRPAAVPEEYILFVGSERPRKNFDRVLLALKEAQAAIPNLKLVKVGAYTYELDRQRTSNLIENLELENDVIFISSFVELSEMSDYYSHALMLVFPSLLEGFGFPVVEAMACGCPVITSDLEPMKSIANNSQVTVDPLEVAEISKAIINLYQNPSLREKMSLAGPIQARKFDWKEMAKKTIEVYDHLL